MSTAATLADYKPETLEDGRFKVVIPVEGNPQTFIYESTDDLAVKLLKAQENATKKIVDQGKVIATLTPLQKQQEWKDHCISEGRKFTAQNPDLLLYPMDVQRQIEVLIYEQLEKNHPSVFRAADKTLFTAANLGTAYMELGESDSLPARPGAAPTTESEEQPAIPGKEPEVEAHPSTPPARSFSTGVRNGVGTHTAPTVHKKNPAEIWAKIDAMPSDVYDRKLATDPLFRKLVDSLPAR